MARATAENRQDPARQPDPKKGWEDLQLEAEMRLEIVKGTALSLSQIVFK